VYKPGIIAKTMLSVRRILISEYWNWEDRILD
jgi:hypothetical protein